MKSVAAIIAGDEPVSDMVGLLETRPVENWSREWLLLDDLLHFYGRIYGGGLNHGISVAADGAIPEMLRLIRAYDSHEVIEWADQLEKYFGGSVLNENREAREIWELEYIDQAPVPEFEVLDNAALKIERALGFVLKGYLVENRRAFE
ncbi:MAG: hypothetical protein OMOMHJEC_00375 [Xanthomonadales bacterium]|nr:hypothetical protein [Xanthomonadales bacterium]